MQGLKQNSKHVQLLLDFFLFMNGKKKTFEFITF